MSNLEELGLLPQHAQLIEASAISPDVARSRGYESIEKKADLLAKGFAESQIKLPGLLVSIRGVAGEIVTYQFRPDSPRIKDDKPVKYENPLGGRIVLDIHPDIRAKLNDRLVPLWITEGARKVDAAISQGLCCIGLLGVWGWCRKDGNGKRAPLPDWDEIDLDGRKVFIAFDSDVTEKKEVQLALRGLVEFLKSQKAEVYIVTLPSPTGEKVGLDDFFAGGGTVSKLYKLATDQLPTLSAHQPPEGPYFWKNGCTYWNKPTKDGSVPTQLANFTCQIVDEVELSDGTESTLQFSIKVDLHGSSRTVLVPSSEFAGLAWVMRDLGARAIVSPGISAKDHLRAAIQHQSEGVKRRVQHTHTGWARMEGKEIFLHGGLPASTGHSVALAGNLAKFILPDPPSSQDLARAFVAWQRLLSLGPESTYVVMALLPFRAILGDVDFGVFLTGPSGAFKSELASLAQRFFGKELDSRSFIANWSSTENMLEELAHLAKDVLLVIDDFAPNGSKNHIDRLHAKAERVLRAQGNLSGRGRMMKDGSLRTIRPPRGLIVSTGEDLPRGMSLRARLVVLEITRGEIDPKQLSACQSDAAEGLYASLARDYIEWLATDRAAVKAKHQSRKLLLRDVLVGDAHLRNIDAIADLGATAHLFIQYIQDRGLLSVQDSAGLERRCLDSLSGLLGQQATLHSHTGPAEQFIRLLASAIGSKLAHVASSSGDAPCNAQGWGWTSGPAGLLLSNGDRIGWTDGEHLYLSSEVSIRLARKLSEGEDALPANRTLIKRLDEARLLLSKDMNRGVNTVRKMLEGRRMDVLHLDAQKFLNGDGDQPDQPDHHNRTNLPRLDSNGRNGRVGEEETHSTEGQG